MYDLVVVGGGAAGLGAARTARHLGASVAMVNEGPPGGDCTFWGCVPSKTLIEQSKARASFDAAMAKVHEVVAETAATESPEVMRQEGIDFYDSHATFQDDHSLKVDGKVLQGKKFVVATGSKPAVPAIDGLAEQPYLTNENIFELSKLPGSLAVLGGGAIGCELAQAFARLGTEVAVFEAKPQLLPNEELEAAEIIQTALEADGVVVKTNTLVKQIAPAPATPADSASQPRLKVSWEAASGATKAAVNATEAAVNATPDTMEFDQILVATGRQPNSQQLGLEEIRVELGANSQIVCGPDLQTSVSNIWAAGDVTGLMGFSHASDMMGRIAANNALRPKVLQRTFKPHKVPYAVFCDPELARVGVDEAHAPAESRVAWLPLTKDDRSRCAGHSQGYVKLIAAPRAITRHKLGGKLIGATIVAPRAGEMIHEPALALAAKILPARIALMPHAYPTYSSAVQKAAAQFFMELEGLTWREPNRQAKA